MPPNPSNHHPRILVVAEFGPSSAGGSWLIIMQLLRGLDEKQIYWWSFFGGKAPPHTLGDRHRCLNISTKLTPNRRLRELKGWILENTVVPYAARDLLAFIRSVKPDFILFLAHLWMIPVVSRVMPQVKTHWHLALHDMPELGTWVASFGQQRTHRFMRYTEELYRKAASQAVISPAMADEMGRRTGVSCSNIFRYGVEPEILPKLLEPTPSPKDDVIRIGYAGAVKAETTFARFISALREVRQRINRKVEVHLFNWDSAQGKDWFDPSLIIEHGPRYEQEVQAFYRQLTWGLAIMKLEDDDPMYNRFSFPCKFTVALAAGVPLICLGNRQSALMNLAKNYRLGLLLTDEDEDCLVDKLCKGLADFSRFDEYRSEIARCAETEFNAERNRKKFQGLMRDAQYGS